MTPCDERREHPKIFSPSRLPVALVRACSAERGRFQSVPHLAVGERMGDRELLDERLELLDNPTLKCFRRQLHGDVGTSHTRAKPLFQRKLERFGVHFDRLEMHVVKLTTFSAAQTLLQCLRPDVTPPRAWQFVPN